MAADPSGTRTASRPACREVAAHVTTVLRSVTSRWMPQCRVCADRGDLDADPEFGRDGAGDDGVADASADRARLAGDHRLVDLAVPCTMRPSAGTLPPGRTITTSPTCNSAGATVSVPLA